MPDAQSHLGISVLTVTPQQLLRCVGFAAELMSKSSGLDWIGLAAVDTGRHSGKEYMACREGIHGSRCGGTMYAQATLQSRCRRDTCGWNLAGLLGSEMSTPVSLAQSPRSQHPPIACGEPPQAFCCTAELCARRAGCSPNAGEMGMCLILLSAPSSVERSKALVLTFSWRHPLHPSWVRAYTS